MHVWLGGIITYPLNLVTWSHLYFHYGQVEHVGVINCACTETKYVM